MSYVTREQVMTALFNLLSTSSSYQTASRRLQHWNSMIGSASLPAIFVTQKTENHRKTSDNITPTLRTLQVDVWIYADTGLSQAVAPVTDLNNLIDAIDPRAGGVLKPDLPQQNRQTLGGLVYDCWIDGELMTWPGDIDGSVCAALIPVKILLP